MNSGAGAIVSQDVAVGGRPILFAQRDEPIDEVDSGWQFTSGRDRSTLGGGQVWSVSEVVDREPSLAAYVNLPAGTVLERDGPSERWQISIGSLP